MNGVSHEGLRSPPPAEAPIPVGPFLRDEVNVEIASVWYLTVVGAAMTIAINASTNPPSLLCKLSGAIPIRYGRGTPLRVGLINLAPSREHLGWKGTAMICQTVVASSPAPTCGECPPQARRAGYVPREVSMGVGVGRLRGVGPPYRVATKAIVPAGKIPRTSSTARSPLPLRPCV